MQFLLPNCESRIVGALSETHFESGRLRKQAAITVAKPHKRIEEGSGTAWIAKVATVVSGVEFGRAVFIAVLDLGAADRPDAFAGT